MTFRKKNNCILLGSFSTFVLYLKNGGQERTRVTQFEMGSLYHTEKQVTLEPDNYIQATSQVLDFVLGYGGHSITGIVHK